MERREVVRACSRILRILKDYQKCCGPDRFYVILRLRMDDPKTFAEVCKKFGK